MNLKNLKLIEEIISTCGIWTSLEITPDSIYLEFSKTQIYNDDYPNSTELVLRFGENILLNIYYNDKEDIKQIINENNTLINSFKEFSFKIRKEEFKFQNIKYTQKIKKQYKKSLNLNNNENTDFSLSFKLEKFAITVGGDLLHLFNDFESLSENEIQNLSNKWCREYLNYWNKKRNGENYTPSPIFESKI